LQGLREGKFLWREGRGEYPRRAKVGPSASTRNGNAVASGPQTSTNRKRLDFLLATTSSATRIISSAQV
jgi:hypothetical protein